MPLEPALNETLANARANLLAQRGANGCWEGELSSSALSTATAVFTLTLFDKTRNTNAHDDLIQKGLRWLAQTQCHDGGWGDTVLSISNVSTTALCWAAFSGRETANEYRDTVERAEKWLLGTAGGLDPDRLAPTIIRRYGKDRTFSVPILTMLALAGRLGASRDGWRRVPQLPFELAACPHQWFQWLRLPVVSYALPALIAIGQVRHHHRPTWNPLTRVVRTLTHKHTSRVLEHIQPESGGFLEATPLTSFVTMSLIGAEQIEHPVVAKGITFLERSVRPDGSWPIDTNLATWVTTLAVNALAGHKHGVEDALQPEEQRHIRDWLLTQQYRTEHPYTHAAPGGWAWTDLTGGVPDADDTPGALLALARLGPPDERTRSAGQAGVEWLLNLQNRDGGMPTFCRGWGALPFDRSSADLTAHAILAWSVWRELVTERLRTRIDAAIARGIRYLTHTQRDDGAWAPLWFGNQFSEDVANLTYGTSRVVRLLTLSEPACTADPKWRERLNKGIAWLVSAQNDDGGWGGRTQTPSSIEETAVALEALACTGRTDSQPAIERGAHWLIARTSRGRNFEPAPIGFYFANLWYFEKLYPLIFTVGALERVARQSTPAG